MMNEMVTRLRAIKTVMADQGDTAAGKMFFDTYEDEDIVARALPFLLLVVEAGYDVLYDYCEFDGLPKTPAGASEVRLDGAEERLQSALASLQALESVVTPCQPSR